MNNTSDIVFFAWDRAPMIRASNQNEFRTIQVEDCFLCMLLSLRA